MQMKKVKTLILSIALFFSGVALLGAENVNGQTSRRLSATPKAFQIFYKRFTSAVKKRDRNAVVAMTSFPFEYGWDAGDEGTYTRRQFLGKFNLIFADTQRLFGQRNPEFYVVRGSYSMTNEEDASHYSFEKRGSTYKFTSLIVEP
jgi:hypothetical protein